MVRNSTRELAAMLILCTGAGAMGSITYLSQSRSVHASATVWPAVADTQSQNVAHQSNNFGPFDKTANATVSVQENIPGYAGAMIPNSVTAYASAWQDSSIDQLGITETGSLDYYTSESYLGNGAASAQSNLTVQFQINGPYGYSIVFTGGVPGEIATLTNLATSQIFDFSTAGYAQGTLMPGRYELDHQITYGQAYHASSMPIDFGMHLDFSAPSAVPEPATVGALAALALIPLRRRRSPHQSARQINDR